MNALFHPGVPTLTRDESSITTVCGGRYENIEMQGIIVFLHVLIILRACNVLHKAKILKSVISLVSLKRKGPYLVLGWRKYSVFLSFDQLVFTVFDPDLGRSFISEKS